MTPAGISYVWTVGFCLPLQLSDSIAFRPVDRLNKMYNSAM